jgi:hypothetical protein
MQTSRAPGLARIRPFAVAAALAVGAGLLMAGGPVGAAAAASRVPVPPRRQAVKVAPAVLAAERAASAKARATGTKVIVSAETNTGRLVTANPDGTFTLTETSSPARAKRHGRWVPIDTTLARRAGGTVAPAATATGVVFSGGGTGPMATLRQGSRRLSLVFPRRLPVPSLSGATATYRDVLPSVDLRLTADASGFSEVLVIKTRAAAANPALMRLKLGIKAAGVRVSGTPGGGATAVDGSGATVFHSDPALMWDSSGSTGRPPAGRGGRHAAARPGAVSAGIGGHAARFPVVVSAAAETLVPDRSLLTAAATRYPVFVDPTWSGNPSQLHWARISSNGWNIYDSTSTNGGDHPRAGYDNWPGGAGEVARTYYQMNTGGSTGTTGIGGAIITAAHMYVNDDWAASFSDTPVELLLVGQPVHNGWNSTDLNWGNKPGDGPLQATVDSHESGSSVVPGTLDFNIMNAAQSAASGNWPNITFDLRAPNEGDNAQWKQFASGGGATISIDYMRRPDFVNGTGNPTITPSAADNGTTYTTSHTPTLNITAEDTDGENVQTNYQVWQGSAASPTTLAAQGTGPASGYAPHGSPYTVSASLPDGVYEWRASATNPISPSNPQGLWTPWSAWRVFTVDTSVPPAPGAESAQFPANQYGAAFGTPGTFTFSTDGSDNVKGYLISVDGDLGSTVYDPASPPPAWTGSGTPAPGKVYWLTADNGNGTGGEQTNGFASAAITPGSTGPHRVYAKAVDQAGNTSAEKTYAFYAGITTPAYVYGDQLVNGYTASDGTTVPAATLAVSHNAVFTVQANCCGIAFADGAQAWLHDGGGTLTPGDSVTMHFEVPATGYWDVGANLTMAQDYGQYSLTLDHGSAVLTPSTLMSGFDAYHSPNVTTTYRGFGVPRDSAGAAIQLTKGVHTLTLTVLGKNPASAGYLAGIDVLRLAPVPAGCPITDLTGCLNNTAISPDNNTASGDADGSGDSFSATALASAGWKPGATLTVDGAPMTLPGYGTGKQDNIAAAGQLVIVPSTGIANDGDAIVFLGFSTGAGGGLSGYTGHISYATGCPYGTGQSYTLDNVPDWIAGPASAATVQAPYRNQAGNTQNTSVHPGIFAVSVPLDFPGCAVSSISLPVVSNGVSGTSPALHILALGIRASSYVGSASTTVDTSQGSYPNTSNWTGSYAARQDGVISGGLGAVTIRIPVHVSIGNGGGGQVRVHLANTLGTAPVTIDDASLATQSAGAVPTGTPVALTFNHSSGVVIPAGGEVTTDPLSYPVGQLGTLLVSVHLAGAVSAPPAHTTARATAYVSAAGTDAVLDTTGTAFTAAGAATITAVPYLTGIDVTTSTNTGSLVLFGDQTVNSDTAAADTQGTTAEDLAADLAAAPGSNGTVPYGVLAEGENSGATSNNLLPSNAGSAAPQSALNPADRSILTAANVRTVLISTGTSDILAGAGASTIEARLSAMAQQIRAFYADNPTSNSTTGQLTVYVATIPPDARLTSAQEAVREAVNQYILGAGGGGYLNGTADGAVDFAAAVSSAGTDTGTAVNPAYLTNGSPNNAYYRALAQQYITSTNPTSGTVGVQPNRIRARR